MRHSTSMEERPVSERLEEQVHPVPEASPLSRPSVVAAGGRARGVVRPTRVLGHGLLNPPCSSARQEPLTDADTQFV